MAVLSSPPVPTSALLDDYLAADDIIDHGHPAIRALAARLRGGAPERTARAVFEYVRDEIAHSYDVDRWSAAYRASDVLAAGDALCHGKSHLLVALLRAEGIPAGLSYQQLSCLHGQVVTHWPEPSRWVRIDPRGNQPGAEGYFADSPEQQRLPYPDAPTSPFVFASVPADLAARLANAVPGEAGYEYLPQQLPDLSAVLRPSGLRWERRKPVAEGTSPARELAGRAIRLWSVGEL